METSTAVVTLPALKIVQQAFTDFKDGNIASIVSVCADDVVFGTYSNSIVRPSGYYYGKEGVLEFFKQVDENINMINFEPREFVVQGDRVMVIGHETATIKHTGMSIDQDWCMSFTVHNGKIQHYFLFHDTYQYAQAFQ